MILRLSEKLRKKLKTDATSALPMDENPLADWSASLFVADRTQYILLSNTASLYTIVFYAKGMSSNEGQFIIFAMNHLREFMEADRMLDVYSTHIAPSTVRVQFGKAYSRAVTGTINQLILAATHSVVNHDMTPYDVSLFLNNLVFSSIAVNSENKYRKPRDVFQSLVHETSN